MTRYNNKFLLYSMLIMIVVTLYLFKGYLFAIFLAVILSLGTDNIFISLKSIIEKSKIEWIRNQSLLLTSTILSLSLLFIVFIPLIYIMIESYSLFFNKFSTDQISGYFTVVERYFSSNENLKGYLETFYKDIEIKSYAGHISSFYTGILSVLKNVKSISIDIVVLVTVYFFINFYSKNLKFMFYRLIPIDKNHKRKLLSNLTNTNTAVLYGMLFNIMAQGFFFGLFIYICNFIFGTDYNAIYLGVLFGFTSIIPIIGAMIVYIPLVVLSFMNEQILFGLLVILYSMGFIGIYVDNFLKMKFISYVSRKFEMKYNINDVMLILIMIVSMDVFGFWGIILGPAIVSVTYSLMKLNYR